MPATSRATSHRGLWIGFGLGAVAFAALAFYGDMGDPRALAARLREYDARWLLLGVLGATANYAIRYLRWELYLRRLDVRIPTTASARIFVAGFAMSISPGKLGEVVKSALLAEEFDVPVATSAPIVLAERLTDLIALVFLAAIGSLAVPTGRALAVPSLVLTGFLLAVFAIPSLGRTVLRWLGRVPMFARIAPKLHTAHSALVSMLSPSPLIGATLLAIAAWFLECVSLWAIVRGFPGVTLTIGESTFAYAAPTIAGAVALMPGGLLVTEASMTGTLRMLGGSTMTGAIAASTTVLVRLATLWWAVLLGLCALAISRRAVRESSSTMPGTTGDAAEADGPEVTPVPGP